MIIEGSRGNGREPVLADGCFSQLTTDLNSYQHKVRESGRVVMEHHEFVHSWRINIVLAPSSPTLQILTSLLPTICLRWRPLLSFSGSRKISPIFFLWAF